MLYFIILYYIILYALIKTDHSGSWGDDSVCKLFAAQVWDCSENADKYGHISVCL